MNIDNIQVNEEVAEKTFFPVAGNKNKKQDPVKATGYRNIALFGFKWLNLHKNRESK